MRRRFQPPWIGMCSGPRNVEQQRHNGKRYSSRRRHRPRSWRGAELSLSVSLRPGLEQQRHNGKRYSSRSRHRPRSWRGAELGARRQSQCFRFSNCRARIRTGAEPYQSGRHGPPCSLQGTGMGRHAASTAISKGSILISPFWYWRCARDHRTAQSPCSSRRGHAAD